MKKRGLFPNGPELTEAYLIEMLTKTNKHLQKHFKTVKVPLGEWQQHIRGDKSIPIWGTPNVITAMHGRPMKNGRFKVIAGESYIGLVRFTDSGVEIESVSPYGASADPESPHYTDQMEMYGRRELKKMSLKKEFVLKNAKRSYHPR